MNSNSTWDTMTFNAERLPIDEGGDELADRQDRLPGFSTAALVQSQVLLIGAGGLGSWIAPALVRKGIGWLDIVDHDTVEVTNLHRQAFAKSDLYQPKAHRLAAYAAEQGLLGSNVAGHDTAFDEQSAPFLLAGAHVAVCAVDNNRTRELASRLCRQQGIPVVQLAVNDTADYGWVFIQESAGPCVACVFPKIAEAATERQRCRPVPAVIDILQIMGGLVLYAIDTLLMERRRNWNYRSIHLVGGAPDVIDQVSVRPGCALCGSPSRSESET